MAYDRTLEEIELDIEKEEVFSATNRIQETDKSLKDLVVSEESEIIIPEEAEKAFDSALEEDFDTARVNILSLMEQGKDAMKSMVQLAKMSEHPRAYEVVATLMKTLLDANKDLIALHEKKTKAGGPPQPKEQHNTQNNYYQMSTAELQNMLEAEEFEDNQDE